MKNNTKAIEPPKVYCHRCGNGNQANFYQTKDRDRGFFSKIPYCKSCIKEMFLEYYRKNKENHNMAFYYLCRKIDIPYIHTNYVGSITNVRNPNSKIYGEDNFISAYMKGFAFADKNGWGASFDNSVGEKEIEGLTTIEELTKVKKKAGKLEGAKLSDQYEILEYDTDYLKGKWGHFCNDDLAYLESEFLDWEDKLGSITEKSIDIIVKQICLQSLEIHNARQRGDDVNRLVNTLRSLLSDAGLVEKQNERASDTRTVGQRIEDIEKIRPVYEVDEDLSDVDNLNKLLVGFVGSTCRALGKTNYYTEKFDELYKPYEIDLINELALANVMTEESVATDNTEERE